MGEERGPGYFGIKVTVTDELHKTPSTGYPFEPPEHAFPESWKSLERQEKEVIGLMHKARMEIHQQEFQMSDDPHLALDFIEIRYQESPPVIEIVFEDSSRREEGADGVVAKKTYKRIWKLHEAITQL